MSTPTVVQTHQAPTFQVGINTRVIGKCEPHKLSYAGAWRPAAYSFADLAKHIGKGHPWMPATLDGNGKRWQKNANYAEVIALDHDDGLTIEQALQHPFISAHSGLLIESSSSKPDHHKFRTVFRLPHPVTDWKTLRICNRYLQHVVGSADPACKDASRFFFGGLGREPRLLNEQATLPETFIEDAIAWNAAEFAKAEAEAELKRQRWASMPRDESGDIVRDALAYIAPYTPGEGRHDTLIAMIGGVLDQCPNGEQLLREWDAGRGEWGRGGFDRILSSVASSHSGRKATLGTLFYLAKQNGFKFPEKSWKQRVMEALHRKPKPKKQQSAKVDPSAVYAGVEYEQGDRVAVWQQALNDGYKYALDQSGAGYGKSHTTGTLTPETFCRHEGDDAEVKQLLYISASHYTASTPTLADWPDLHGRHDGLIEETTSTGTKRLRRAQKGEERTIAANCSRNKAIAAFRAKNVAGADNAGLICSGCPLEQACKHSSGNGFGFKKQRRDALSAPRLRLHPQSAPAGDFDYSKAVAIWDEPAEQFQTTKQVHITTSDVDETISYLYRHAPEIAANLATLLSALRDTFERQQGRYGLSHPQIMEGLPTLPDDFDIKELEAALSPDFSFLDPEVAEGVNLSDLQGAKYTLDQSDYSVVDGKRVYTDFEGDGRKRTTKKKINLRSRYGAVADSIAEDIDRTIIKQWLPDLCKVLMTGTGAFQLTYETFTITRPNGRHRAIANSCKGNIFLDATLSAEDLAMMLGCEVDDIYVCRQRPEPTPNIKIIQVNDLGRLGMQRGKDQLRRVDALVQEIGRHQENTKVIDFKKFSADGAWWRDSRGVNDFEHVNTLILSGTPCPNLASLQAEYACLKGAFPTENDELFSAWVDRKIAADIMQGIGRLRANRRQNEKLTVYLLSNFDLGIPTEQCEAQSITPEAGSKLQRTEAAIRDAVMHLRHAGRKVTQQAVAAATGLSQGYVSRFRELLLLLLDPFSSKSNNPEEGKNTCTEALTGALTEIFDASPPFPDLITAIDDFMEWGFSLDDFKIAADNLPFTHRTTLLTVLFATQNDWQGAAS